MAETLINMDDGVWLVPFRGRNPSGAYRQNFLWQYGSIYVMDNHRAALWCWLQHIDPNLSHSIFHIDQHTDTLQSRLDEWLQHLPPSWPKPSINEYLIHAYQLDDFPGEAIPVFRWDNYLSIYFATFGQNVQHCIFATHRDGDNPNHDAMWVDLWEIPDNLDYWLDRKNRPWIMNIDLDYFFWDGDEPGLMVSDAYLRRCFEIVRQKIADHTIAVTTICLTPDGAFTGGWEPSERLAERILNLIGINFRLP
jgi:hypothetical protein